MFNTLWRVGTSISSLSLATPYSRGSQERACLVAAPGGESPPQRSRSFRLFMKPRLSRSQLCELQITTGLLFCAFLRVVVGECASNAAMASESEASLSVPGQSGGACVCNAGYTGNGSSLCVACEPGTFKAIAGKKSLGIILMDAQYVDVDEEGANMVKAIESSKANTRSSLDAFIASLDDRHPPAFAVVPEQESSSISLMERQSASIRSYVTSGGRLVVGRSGSSRSRGLLNGLFGWSLSEADCSSSSRCFAQKTQSKKSQRPSDCSSSSSSSSSSSTIRKSEEFGFGDGPGSLPGIVAVRCISTSSLPTGATAVYVSSSGAASVWVAAIGKGHVIGLAPDFFERAPAWDDIVQRATTAWPSSSGAKHCADCPAGKFSSVSGSSACLDCRFGEFLPGMTQEPDDCRRLSFFVFDIIPLAWNDYNLWLNFQALTPKGRPGRFHATKRLSADGRRHHWHPFPANGRLPCFRLQLSSCWAVRAGM